jgi:putative membrane protein
MISEHDNRRIAEAVRQAEMHTSGEIVVVVTEQASAYRSLPIVLGLLIALAVPWPLIWITRLSAEWVFLTQLIAAPLAVLALSWPGRRHRLVPGFVKRRRAEDAALREFASRGLTHTRERTGVLIYVAAAEHHAHVIADIGIAARVDEGVWRETVEALVEDIRAGRAGDGLVAAVERVGAILAREAPIGTGDRDELPNRVFVV